MKTRVSILIVIVLTAIASMAITHAAVAQTPTPFPTPTPMWNEQMSQSSIQVDLSMVSPTFTMISNTIGYVSQISNTISITYTATITNYISAMNPFSLARGLVMMMNEVPWIGITFTWFTIALIIIIVLMVVRLLVSTWGIIKRIIDLIKLIPGI